MWGHKLFSGQFRVGGRQNWFCSSRGHLFHSHEYRKLHSIFNNDPFYLGVEWLPVGVMSWQRVKEMYQK